jgi:TolA-binding protein
MVSRIVLMLLGVALLTSSACGQAADPGQGEQGAAANQPATKADLDALADRIENAVAQKLQSLNDRLTHLEMRVQVLSDYRQSDQTVLHQIAQQDDSGRSFLRIDASHEPMKRELQRAITEVAPDEGTVIVHNTMDTLQSVAINGEMYDVFPNSRRRIPGVKYGEFRVQLRGRPEETRRFEFPHPEVEVTIRPATRPVQWINSAPVYYTYAW